MASEPAKALFYKAFAGSDFLPESVKIRHFERKWCSKWCSGMQNKICHREEKEQVQDGLLNRLNCNQ